MNDLQNLRFLFSARISKTIARLSLTLFILICVSGYAMAEDRFQPFQDDNNVPWHIIADKISYDDKANVYIATGNVIIRKKNKNLSADYVRFDQKTMTAFAEGHVVMAVGENVLTGSSMEMNLDNETGTVYDGTIFFKENHFYIRGNKIQKVGKDSYTADKASVSSCDGDQPAWKITGRDVKVTVEGYGFAKHAALWAKKVPVLYSPFFVFPLKQKRQTGLLTPQVGDSNRKGAEYIQPFYWAINDSSDATFYFHYMDLRGEKLGLEYRYVLDEKSKGTLMVDFLNDRKVDDGSPGSDKWGYGDDNVLRPNSDRYWFRMKHDHALPAGFSAKLDLDIVSDQDYLHEFKEGYTGFEETRDYFNKNYGRELDEYDDFMRLNRLNLSRNWSLYSFNAELRWNDNVISRRQEETDPTLQQLPVIRFNGSKQKILTSPFYFDLGSEYTYFYRKDGEKGHRGDVYPRFYLPYSFGNYLAMEPSVGVRETVWYVDKDAGIDSDKDTRHRELYDIKIDLSSEIYNIFNIKRKHIEKIKHTIRPQIIYDYIPQKDQSELPSFDDLDRIEKKNLITYSITNTLTSRLKINTAKKDVQPSNKLIGDESDDPSSYAYNQLCRFKLEQSYDINKEKENDPEPFSPIHAKLEFTPIKYLSIIGDADWSHYDRNFRSRNIAVTVLDMRRDKLFIEHRFQRDVSESIYTDLHLKISDRLSAYSKYERNLFDGENLQYGFGFLYETQCWSLDANYINEGNDSRFKILINLYGIGEIG